jgi:hypothetical protein
MREAGRYLLVAVIAAAVALAASWAVRSLTAPDPHASGELHKFVHEQLNLDSGQTTKIEALEAQFAQQRVALDAKLREANAQLAHAIAREHQYGPEVSGAVDQSHMAMGELQKATLAHVFAMRAVLRPDQAARFDQAVRHALTGTGGE